MAIHTIGPGKCDAEDPEADEEEEEEEEEEEADCKEPERRGLQGLWRWAERSARRATNLISAALSTHNSTRREDPDGDGKEESALTPL